MRSEFVRLVEREIENCAAGRPARIVCNMNQLEDPEMCVLLSRASQAGVPIDLVVRGLCCLAPGVPGVTENMRVRSIVGRFLEHSRIFHFAAGSDDPLEGEFLIGSADWMRRNLSGRVEARVPIRQRLRARLWEILEDASPIAGTPGRCSQMGHMCSSSRTGGRHRLRGQHATMMRLALPGTASRLAAAPDAGSSGACRCSGGKTRSDRTDLRCRARCERPCDPDACRGVGCNERTLGAPLVWDECSLAHGYCESRPIGPEDVKGVLFTVCHLDE
jgi:hypothetical protein